MLKFTVVGLFATEPNHLTKLEDDIHLLVLSLSCPHVWPYCHLARATTSFSARMDSHCIFVDVCLYVFDSLVLRMHASWTAHGVEADILVVQVYDRISTNTFSTIWRPFVYMHVLLIHTVLLFTCPVQSPKHARVCVCVCAMCICSVHFHVFNVHANGRFLYFHLHLRFVRYNPLCFIMLHKLEKKWFTIIFGVEKE